MVAIGDFAIGTSVRANKFRGTVVNVRPTHRSHQGKIPVDSGRTVKWFRPSELTVESKTLPLLGDGDIDEFKALPLEQPSLLVVEPNSTDTCPECGATLSLPPNGSCATLTCAYCEWSSPEENTSKLIPLDQTSINPQRLQPHPENDRIYGEHEDVSALVELIQQSGWIKPIVVSPNGRIISGHRRWKAAVELRWQEVPISVREFTNEMAELEALLLENATREKTAEQKVREGRTWESIEGEQAKLRQKATQNNHAGRAVVENFPPLVNGGKGKTRDAIASRVGLGSGRNYDKAKRVVEEIDKLAATHFEQNQEFAKILRHTLNQKSVHAAYQLLEPPSPKKHRSKVVATGTTVDLGWPAVRDRVIVVNENSPFKGMRGTVSGRPNQDGVTVSLDTGGYEYLRVDECLPEPLPESTAVSSSTASREPVEPNAISSVQNLIETDPFPSSLIECLTIAEVYALIDANPTQASQEFLEMDWRCRNELRQLTQGSIDNLIIGKRKETLEDVKPYLGLLSTDRLAEIEFLKQELKTVIVERDELLARIERLTPQQLQVDSRPDEWLYEIIKLATQELNRRHQPG